MIKKVDEDEFYMPKDIQKYFKSHLKDKESLKIIKSNTKEYNLIMGLLNTYGVLSYDKFYEMFNNIISCDKEYLFERLTILNNFYFLFPISKKLRSMLMFRDFPKRRGLVNRFASPHLSRSLSISAFRFALISSLVGILNNSIFFHSLYINFI